MAGDPYTIDPIDEVIYSGHGDNLTSTVDSVFLNGSSYTLQGSTLVPEQDGFPQITLPPDRPTRIWADPYAKTQVSYKVDRRQVNSQSVRSRVYGVGGTVNISLADGTAKQIELNNTVTTRADTRLYQTMSADGNIIISSTGYNFATNEELRKALNDAQASYLTPLEAVRELVIRSIASSENRSVAEYLQTFRNTLMAYNNPFYAAVGLMANLQDISSLDIYTNYWI